MITRQRPMFRGCAGFLVMLGALGLALFVWRKSANSGAAASTAAAAQRAARDDSLGGPDHHVDAYLFCEQTVKASLRSATPNAAAVTGAIDFPPDARPYTTRAPAQHYRVQSEATFELGGATQIADFVCRAHERADGSWQLDDLQMARREKPRRQP